MATAIEAAESLSASLDLYSLPLQAPSPRPWKVPSVPPSGTVLRITGEGAILPRSPVAGGLELALVVSGTARTEVGETPKVLGPRSLIWSTSGSASPVASVTPGAVVWVTSFNADLVRRVCRAPRYRQVKNGDADGIRSIQVSRAAVRRLTSRFEKLAEQAPDSARFEVHLAHLLLSAWTEHQLARKDARSSLHPVVDQAARILRTRAATTSLDALAKTCGASASWLSRLFREQMRVSLVDYRNHYRIERFLELYGDGRQTNIAQAALRAGFGSYAQFHRIFWQRLGCGPSELRPRLSE